jgi:hypothetical protein
VTVAGAHSGVGGSYHRDGLAIRSVLSAWLDRLLAAEQSDDWAAFDRESRMPAFGEAGRSMLTNATVQAHWLEQ